MRHSRPINPHRAEAPIKLGDGIVRRLKIDLHAMVIAEQITGRPFSAMVVIDSVAIARAWLFAGLIRDAERRGQDWTTEYLDYLVADEQVVVLSSVIQRVIIDSLPDPNGRLAKDHEQSEPESEDAGERKGWDWETALWLALRLGLRPDEFWAMTLREFQLLQDASHARIAEDQRFHAAMTANVMNCWIKKPVTVEKLLGEKPSRKRPGNEQDSEVASQQFASMCPDRSGDPIWQKLEEASQRAEEERRGKPKTPTTPGV